MSVSILYPIIIIVYYIKETYFVFNQKIKVENALKFLLNILFLYLVNIFFYLFGQKDLIR